ncbi:hypothetical protein Ait01nite_063610 [Actinoplanes italicus]|uniref:Uncharacterized protein DUF4253 n=1 Tax=Actinoplanes italicus TaxID=113567 RepID=A0A2T0K4R8_9ACTN|nr:DUF4253 domain-containing protein [Actinoplanes italicus]PRX17903.1 uncharacterized protein DUF4253 [Actinoplanes italicus]GIE33316.1 hypothetical protein Ait01nite_063610 [Actinoplanes italicus]
MSATPLAPLDLVDDPTGGGWDASLDLLWISAGPPRPGWWSALRAQHGRTGLWPLLLGSLDEGSPERPWRDGDDLGADHVRSAPGDHYPGALLGAWWAQYQPDDESGASTWPGLARRGELQADPDERAAEAADLVVIEDWLRAPRLGLIPAGRGADALTTAGWSGPLNFENDIAKISTVLRNWEDRFGVRVIGASFATLYLSVAAPPVDEEHALEVAAEHYAFCPDNVDQGCGSFEDYAKQLVDAPLWTFWWD